MLPGGRPTTTGGFEFERSGDGNTSGFEFELGPRYRGSKGRGLPVINSPRAKYLGKRRERDWKIMAWWRLAILNDPKVFPEFYESRLKELNINEFNARRAAEATKNGGKAPAPLTMAHVRDAINKIETIINNNPGETATDKVNKLYEEVYNNCTADIRAFIAFNLNYQHGREVKGFNHDMNARGGKGMIFGTGITDPTYPTKEQFIDLLGQFSLYEALDTLKATECFYGLGVDRNKDNTYYSITSELLVDSQGKPLKMVDCHVEKVQDGDLISYKSNFTIGKNVPQEEMDRAICLMAEAIATHRQACDLITANVAEIATGSSTPLRVMRLMEELIGEYHMQVNCAVSAKIDAVITGYPPEVRDRWALLKQLSFVYHPSDAGKFNPHYNLLTIPAFQALDASVRFERDDKDPTRLKDSEFNHHVVDQFIRDTLDLNPNSKDIYEAAIKSTPRSKL